MLKVDKKDKMRHNVINTVVGLFVSNIILNVCLEEHYQSEKEILLWGNGQLHWGTAHFLLALLKVPLN